MKISIITVCYNSAKTIRDTLNSIAIQDYPNIEHIIVDGGSSDDTLTLIAQYPSVTALVSESDAGIYDAMNKGISLATGDIIGFLNSDDIYANEKILSQVAQVFSNASVDACYADLVYVDQTDTNKIIRYWQSQPFKPGLFKAGWMPAHPTFFVRRPIYQKAGGFDLNYPRQADFELTMRFLEVYKINAVYINQIWVRMRMGGVSNNSVLGVIKGNIEAYHACKKNKISVSMWPFIIHKIASRIPQFFSKPKHP